MRSIERGFSLVELLVVLATASALLAGIGGFYVFQQRSARHQQVEIETSQSLRSVLDQMSLELRTAGYNPSQISGFVPFVTADVANVDFKLDADGNGTYDSSSANEHRGFRRTVSGGTATIETLQAPSTWSTFADFVSTTGTIFRYFDCSGAALTAPVTGGNLSNIARIDITLSVTRPIIGGTSVNRTQSVSVRLRNKSC